MNFFPGKKGHLATKKRALPKTWGAWPPLAPPVPTPLVALQPELVDAPNTVKLKNIT
jgi:hypothetical protein